MVGGDETLEAARLLRRRPRVLLQAALLGLLAVGLLAALGQVPLPLLAPTLTVVAVAVVDGDGADSSSSTSSGGGSSITSGGGVATAKASASLPALLLLALSAAANLLYCLAQRWSLPVRVWAGYGPARVPAEATAVLVLPKPHKGEPALLPVTRDSAGPAEEEEVEVVVDGEEETGSKQGTRKGSGKKQKKKKTKAASSSPAPLAFVYQHRTYMLGRGGFQQRRPSLTRPLAHYLREPGPFVGKGGERQAEAARALYGPNRLDVAVPPLKSLLIDEALSPVSVLKALDLALSAADR